MEKRTNVNPSRSIHLLKRMLTRYLSRESYAKRRSIAKDHSGAGGG